MSFENRDLEMMSSIDFPIGRVSVLWGGGDMTEEIQTVKKKRKKKAVVHVSKVSQLGLRSISLCNPGTFATLLDLIG